MTERSLAQRTTRVFINPQTYRNLAYELMSFPLGIFYFVVIVSGLSLGIGLLILGVGLLFLMMTTAFILQATDWERRLHNTWLGAELTAIEREPFRQGNILRRFWTTLTHHSGLFWRSLFYFAGHFIFAVVGSVAAVVSIVLPLVLLFAPLYYQEIPIEIFDGTIVSINQALLASLVGLLLGFLFLNVNNLLVHAWRLFGGWLLADPTQADAWQSVRDTRRLTTDAQSVRDAERLRRLLNEGESDKIKRANSR